jgi:alpha,alpha-trehalase
MRGCVWDERRARAIALILLVATGCRAERRARSTDLPDPLAPAAVARLRAHIHRTWPVLTRTLTDLPRAARDEKTAHPAGEPWPVYVPADERTAIEARLTSTLSPSALRELAVRVLPPTPAAVGEHGLLYLPRPYVVPGGRFNEMYGWDSAFIVMGLLRDGQSDLARDMVDDFLYEVDHYGGVLNANRTYYLTRSQPPLLSLMVLGVYGASHDRARLARARAALVATHAHWTAPPHLIATLGLSRYHDHGQGPAPEVVAGERDAHGQTHFDRVRAHLRAQPDAAVARYYDRAADALTPLFYEGDRGSTLPDASGRSAAPPRVRCRYA